MHQLTVLATLFCCLFSMGGTVNRRIVGEPSKHFDISAEVVKVIINLIRLDRATLKTITAIHNSGFNMDFNGIAAGNYHHGQEIGDCYHIHARPLCDAVTNRTDVVDNKIDLFLDEMVENWVSKKTQLELEAYWKQYWEDRNKLYRYATRQNDHIGCKGSLDHESCQAFSSQHLVYINMYKGVSERCGLYPILEKDSRS